MADPPKPPAADKDEEFPLPFEDRFGTVVELKAKDPGSRMFAVYPTREYVQRRSIRYRRPLLAALGLTLAALGANSLLMGGFDPGRWVLVAVIVVPLAAFGLLVWNLTMRAAMTVTVGRTIHVRIATIRLTVDPRLGEKLALGRSGDGRLWNVFRTSHGYRALKFRLAAEAFPGLADFFREHLGEQFEEMKSE